MYTFYLKKSLKRIKENNTKVKSKIEDQDQKFCKLKSKETTQLLIQLNFMKTKQKIIQSNDITKKYLLSMVNLSIAKQLCGQS